MIDPLKVDLVRLLLDGIRHDRLGESGATTGATQFQSDAVIKGVINSFVSVEEYKKKGNLEVREMVLFSRIILLTNVLYSFVGIVIDGTNSLFLVIRRDLRTSFLESNGRLLQRRGTEAASRSFNISLYGQSELLLEYL